MAKKMNKKFISLICMFTLVFSCSVTTNKTDAAALTTISDTLSDSRASETYVQHTFIFRAITAVPLSGKVVLDFPTGFDTSDIDAADMLFYSDSSNPPTTAYTLVDGAADATNTGVANTDADGGVITFTLCSTGSGTCDFAANDYVKIVIGDGASGGIDDFSNPTTGVYQIDVDTQNAASAAIDGGSIAVAVVASGVAVSATIDAYITFASNDYAVGFGSWTGGSTVKRFATSDETGDTSESAGATDPFQLTVSTNGTGGVSITAHSVNAALTSSSDSIAAMAEDSIAGGTEGYGLYFTDESSLTRDAAWDDTATGTLTTSAQVVATSAATALSGATIDGELAAAISATTEAGVYSDTLVFVATATY